MKCPVCVDAALQRAPTTQGVEIDRCPACQGVWLERGEIFLFATKARSIAAKLERALADQKPTDRLSPASGEPMSEIIYPGGPRIDRCPRSGGLWFDAGGFQDASVTVEGWYRRAPVPYIELRTIRRDGKVTKSWVATFNRLGAVAITAAGMAWAAATFLGFAAF